jgi:hypothetical protein
MILSCQDIKLTIKLRLQHNSHSHQLNRITNLLMLMLM